MSSHKVENICLGRVFWSAALAMGQASIRGTVSDSSDGAIPGVAIRIKNLETGAERNQVTDEVGRYEAASLTVGRYEVWAEKSGFCSEAKTGVSLTVGETTDLALRVGDVRQTVEAPRADLRGLLHEERAQLR